MLNLSEFLGITISGNAEYDCILSPAGRIVKTFPDNGYLLGRDIQEVYAEHCDKMKVIRLFNPAPPKVLDSDKFPDMLKKNSSLAYLVKKFNCDML